MVESVRKKRCLFFLLCYKVLNGLEKERCIVCVENGVWKMICIGIEKGYYMVLKYWMYEMYFMYEMEMVNLEID